jgi:ATP-dependent helicase IRC3
MKLRNYQEICLKKIEESDQAGISRQMVVLPTGAGKTVIFSSLIKKRNVKTLVIAHTIELLKQAKEKLSVVAPEIEAGIFCGNEKNSTKQVTIASIQTAHRNLDVLRKQGYELLIIDEANHAAAKTYKKLIDYLGFYERDKLLVGFTATPRRGDKVKLDDIFEKVVYSLSIREMVKKGYLVKPEGIHVKVGIDLRKVRTEKGDFKQGSLREAMCSTSARRIVIDTIKKFATDKQGIIFAVDIKHSEILKEDMIEAGFNCDVVHSKVSVEDRSDRLQKFAIGQLQFISNPMILTEGFDCPRADCMINAAPTQNRSLYIQKAGRVLRPFEGKESALLIDFGQTKKKHNLRTVVDLMGEEAKLKTVVREEGLLIDLPKQRIERIFDFHEQTYDPLKESQTHQEILDILAFLNTPYFEGNPATFKQIEFIKSLSRQIGLEITQEKLDLIDSRTAFQLIKKMINYRDTIPATSKQMWKIRSLKRQGFISDGIDLDQISKMEARKVISSSLRAG